MPTKKSAAAKYQSPHYPTKIREAAADHALAARARKKLGRLALGKPKSSKVHKDYVKADRTYQTTGRSLARLTGYRWKTRRR